MTPTRARDTPEGRVYNDLRNLANREHRDPAEYLALYALEGFLARLAEHEDGTELVLKGGVLMSAYTERRPTRDIDLAATGIPNSVPACEDRIRAIAALPRDDGLTFDMNAIHGEVIRDEADYTGVRVHLTATLAKAQIPFHVDMNFGDPIFLAPTPTALPLLLGGTLSVLSYPLTMVIAEKVVTMVDRGVTRPSTVGDLATQATLRGFRPREFPKSARRLHPFRRSHYRGRCEGKSLEFQGSGLAIT